jgi:membrane protein YqaA with SNARE-associated domain
MTPLAAYGALFASAFLAATVLPAQSEAVLAAMLLAGEHPAAVLIAVASAGNVLGAVVNWALGRGLERCKDRSWFPAKAETLERAQLWYQRYGKWSLLLSWAPFIGDPLTLAAGIMRERFLVVLALVTVAKVGRYLVLAAALA